MHAVKFLSREKVGDAAPADCVLEILDEPQSYLQLALFYAIAREADTK